MTPTLPMDASFLAPGDTIADWRLVLAYEAAATGGVFDKLPATLEELAGNELDPGALRTVLSVLEAWGIVAADGTTYSHGRAAPEPPVDDVLVRHGLVIRRWAELIGPRLRDRTAAPPSDPAPSHQHGLRPPRMDLLARNAQQISRSLVDECLKAVPGCKTALDIGGGHGVHAMELAQRGIAVTLQDLPPVVEALKYKGAVTAAGVQLFAGDLRDSLPDGSFDLVLCSAVTNMLDPETNQDLFRRVRPLLNPGGVFAVVSYMRGRDEVSASFGLQMLCWTDGGDAYSASDYREWLRASGYRDVRTAELRAQSQTVLLADA